MCLDKSSCNCFYTIQVELSLGAFFFSSEKLWNSEKVFYEDNTMILFWTGVGMFERVQQAGSFTGKTEKEYSNVFQIKVSGCYHPLLLPQLQVLED